MSDEYIYKFDLQMSFSPPFRFNLELISVFSDSCSLFLDSQALHPSLSNFKQLSSVFIF